MLIILSTTSQSQRKKKKLLAVQGTGVERLEEKLYGGAKLCFASFSPESLFRINVSKGHATPLLFKVLEHSSHLACISRQGLACQRQNIILTLHKSLKSFHLKTLLV